jgi:hypothetical protein
LFVLFDEALFFSGSCQIYFRIFCFWNIIVTDLRWLEILEVSISCMLSKICSFYVSHCVWNIWNNLYCILLEDLFLQFDCCSHNIFSLFTYVMIEHIS